MIVLTAVFFAALAPNNGPLPYSQIENPRQAANQESLHVLVRDNGGNPVPGADVICAFSSQPFSEQDSAPHTVRTGVDGRCAFTGLRPGQLYVFCKQGASGTLAPFTIGHTASIPEVELVLGAYHAISGQLVDPEGAPIVGARPFVGNAIECSPTDASGHFTAQHMVTDNALLTFVKEGFATTTQHMRFDSHVILTMPRGVPFRVRVEGVPAGAIPEIRVWDRDGSRTSVSPAWKAGPVSEPVWVSLHAAFIISVDCTHDGTTYHGNGSAVVNAENREATVKLEPFFTRKPEEISVPGGSVIRTYLPVNWMGTGTISGRVLTKETQLPVAATVACQLVKNNFVYTRTNPDGRFEFSGLPSKDMLVSVDADDATLYDPGPMMKCDLTATATAEDVLFSLERGVAISGAVTNLENPTDVALVLLRPIMRGYVDPIRTEPGGAFTIEHLPPGDEYMLALRQSYQPAEFGAISLGPLPAGTHLSNARLDMRSIVPSDLHGVIKGVAMDSAGHPISGLTILVKGGDGRSRIGTNMDGTFELPDFQSGPVVLSAMERVLLLMLHESASKEIEREILEGATFNVPDGNANERIRLVIGDARPSRLVAGRVVTEDGGEPKDCQLEWIGPNGMGTASWSHGEFAISNLHSSENVALEFRSTNYQAKVLLEGRDFSRDDLNVRVVLKPLPYSRDQSVFEQVTGVPAEKAPDFPQLARIVKWGGKRYGKGPGDDNDLATPSVTIQDAEKKPLRTVYLLRWNDKVAGVPDITSESALMKTTIEDPAGKYERPVPFVWIWADGCARFWYTPEHEAPPNLLNTITLQPESTLRITVREKSTSKPFPNCNVVLDPNVVVPNIGIDPAVFSRYNGPNKVAPKTDEKGEVFYRNLAAGTYTVDLTFANGDKMSDTIAIGKDENVERTFEH